MLLKTSVLFGRGRLAGTGEPLRCPLPRVGYAVVDASRGWRVCRLSEDAIILADLFSHTFQTNKWSQFLQHSNGFLLRRLGKVRVVYLIRNRSGTLNKASGWHTNANLVTGVTKKWLEDSFQQTPVVEGHVIID